jgi:hypothetical protein
MKLTLQKNFAEIFLDPQDLELEALCPTCQLGRMPSGANCSTCEGTGIVLTPVGEHLLAFVIRQAPAFRRRQKISHVERNS